MDWIDGGAWGKDGWEYHAVPRGNEGGGALIRLGGVCGAPGGKHGGINAKSNGA